MFPTKDNFKGRWGTECVYCKGVESDMHLFSCVGYTDLLCDVDIDWFLTLNASTDELLFGARKLLEVEKRLKLFNVSSNKNSSDMD